MNPIDIAIAAAAFFIGLLAIPILLMLARGFGLYTIVAECEAQVFTLFGKVIGTIDEAGLYFPLSRFGPRALLIAFFGKKYKVSTALRQHYLRSQMVNSEEGTPMGVGIWYEMQVNNPVDYLFINSNPEGSLQANVASSTISTLSTLKWKKCWRTATVSAGPSAAPSHHSPKNGVTGSAPSTSARLASPMCKWCATSPTKSSSGSCKSPAP